MAREDLPLHSLILRALELLHIRVGQEELYTQILWQIENHIGVVLVVMATECLQIACASNVCFCFVQLIKIHAENVC